MSAPRDDKAGDDKNPLVERPPDDFAERIAAAEGDEKLHVRVAADLSPDLSFGQRWLIVTDKRIVILDAEEAPLEISLGEVTSAQMRSLVGGARLVIERKDKTPVSVYVSSTAAPTFADAADRIGELDRDLPYVLYCNSGNRSADAAQLMTDLGFSEVYEVDGGIQGWLGAGLPVV